MSNSLMVDNAKSPLKSSAVEESQRKMAVVYGMASIFGAQIDANATKLWLSLLSSYSASQVEAGAKRLMQNEELYKMPPPAILIRCIKEIEQESNREKLRIIQDRYNKFEKAKEELCKKYQKQLDWLCGQCFCKAIDGNEYKKRTDDVLIVWRKKLDEIKKEEEASQLELSSGQGKI